MAIDSQGNERPDWAERLTRRPLKSKRFKPDTWTGAPGWAQLVRSLASRLDERGRPVAVAAFRIG